MPTDRNLSLRLEAPFTRMNYFSDAFVAIKKLLLYLIDDQTGDTTHCNCNKIEIRKSRQRWHEQLLTCS